MGTKFITNIVVFATTLALSVWFIGIPEQTPGHCAHYQHSQTAEKIESLLSLDIQNGNSRFMDSRGFESGEGTVNARSFDRYANAVWDYSKKSASLDDSDLPQDFQDAWHTHMKAWDENAKFLNKMKQPSFRSKFTDEDIERINDNQTNKINSSWYDVLNVAADYGAYPEDAY